MPKLLLFLQDESAREVLFKRDTLAVGRRNDNDVTLPYPTVSGHHAVFTFVPPNSCFVEDLKSTNGTLVNGQLIGEKTTLKDRDQIDVGGQKFVYLEGAPVSAAKRRHHHPAESLAQSATSSLSLASPHEPLSPFGLPKRASAEPASNAKREEEQSDVDADSGLHFPTIYKIPQKSGEGETEQHHEPMGDTEFTPNALSSGNAILEDSKYTPPAPIAIIEAIGGANSQRKLLLRPGDFTLGRPGFQLATVRVTADGCRLMPVEGEPPLKLRGQIVPKEGMPLFDQDRFNIGNSPLQFRLLPKPTAPTLAPETSAAPAVPAVPESVKEVKPEVKEPETDDATPEVADSELNFPSISAPETVAPSAPVISPASESEEEESAVEVPTTVPSKSNL